MKKELRKPYFIGMFNGVVFTFAFLIFLVVMNEEFGSSDRMDHAVETMGVDTMLLDLSVYDKESIEVEYLKRYTPEHILDVLLHRYSMVGTIWEEKWNYVSDIEKVKILLGNTTNVSPDFKSKSGAKELKYAGVDSSDYDNRDGSFTVVYRKRVNGYKVKAVAKLAVSDVDIISSDFVFTKNRRSFTLHSSCFGDTLFCKGRLDYECENSMIFRKYKNITIKANYHKHIEKDHMMPMYTPFFFMDLDFDGVDELVIVHHSMAVRYHDGYDVYRIVEGKPFLIDYPPYNSDREQWGFGMTDYPEFDFKKKTITCPYPEGPGGLPYIGQIIYGISKKQKDTVVVNGRIHYFNHLEPIKEEEFERF